MVALVNGLTVGCGGEPVDQRDAEPPTVGVGCMGIKSLSQPIRSDMKQQAMSYLVHSPFQPLLMYFEGVIAQVHSMRDDEVNHGVEMAVKHASIDVQNAEALFKQPMWGCGRDGGKVRVAHRWLGEWPCFRTPLKRFNQTRGHTLKRLIEILVRLLLTLPSSVR